MANHIRQQIRERVGTTLTGLTTTGSNVFQSRVYNLENAFNCFKKTNLDILVFGNLIISKKHKNFFQCINQAN